MFMTKRNILLMLAVCALLLPATLTAKRPVTRPITISGNMTLVLDLATMTWASKDWGQATHMGRYASEGSGFALDPSLANGAGVGVNTVANGDLVFWSIVAENGVWTATYTGGTGRFMNVSGGFAGAPDVTVGPGPSQLTYVFTYTGHGTITY